MEVSVDGGTTFTPVEPPIPGDARVFYTLLARPNPLTIVVGSEGGGRPAITYDDGHEWTQFDFPSHSFVRELVTDDGGLWVAIGQTSDGDQTVWISRDGGASWDG
jgi:hypothetical protein